MGNAGHPHARHFREASVCDSHVVGVGMGWVPLGRQALAPTVHVQHAGFGVVAAQRFAEVVEVLAFGVDDLAVELAKTAPKGPWLFPEDQLSDMQDRLFAAEITREQAFRQLGQEVPYALTVETEEWKEFQNGEVRVEQTIYVERASQRAIVLGKSGERIRRIREAAQAELQEATDRKAHLFLFVKVRANWTEDPERYAPWALDYNAE